MLNSCNLLTGFEAGPGRWRRSGQQRRDGYSQDSWKIIMSDLIGFLKWICSTVSGEELQTLVACIKFEGGVCNRLSLSFDLNSCVPISGPFFLKIADKVENSLEIWGEESKEVNFMQMPASTYIFPKKIFRTYMKSLIWFPILSIFSRFSIALPRSC